MSKARGKSTTKSRDKKANDKLDEETLRKTTALAYVVLTKEDSEDLLGMSADEMESKLQKIFELNPDTDLKDASILDYYVGAVYWCKQQGFNAQQLSGFFTVNHTLLEKIKDQQASLIDTFKDFRKMLVGINADGGPEVESGGLEFFNSEQAKNIADYMNNSLFQHFKLYEFMFSQQQSMEIVGSELSVEVPLPADMPFPPPLDEGISESTYKEFLSLPTPSLSTTADEKTEEEKVATPVEIELPPEAKDLFNKLSPEDVRSIVQDIATECLQNLQTGVEQKIRNHETNVLNRINKIHVVLPDNTDTDTTTTGK